MLKDFIDKQISRCNRELCRADTTMEELDASATAYLRGELDAYTKIREEIVAENKAAKSAAAKKATPKPTKEQVLIEGAFSLVVCPSSIKDSVYDDIMSNKVEVKRTKDDGTFQSIGSVGAGVKESMCFFQGEVDRFATDAEINQYYAHLATEDGHVKIILNKDKNTSQIRVKK